MRPDLEKRFRHFLARLEQEGLEAFLITHPANLNYLFNFTGSSGLGCVLQGQAFLLVDARYLEQARSQVRNCTPLLATPSLEESLQELLSKQHGGKRLGVEARRLHYDLALRLQSWDLRLELVPTYDLVEELRMVKDSWEVAVLQQALEMAQQALERLEIRPGISEREVAARLEYECRKAGSEGPAFDTIVASGPRSALPHGVASERSIGKDEPVLIDFGLRHQGYCSDLTRVYLPPSPLEPEVFAIVREAQQAALETIRPGVLSSEVDSAARRVIERYGYGEFFGHGTGHGLGLEVHEPPSVSWRHSVPLQPGMVFTVEPGIYLPGRFGIRLEEVVVVEEKGYRLLSRASGEKRAPSAPPS